MGWIRTNLKVLPIVPGSAWGMLNLWLKLCLCHCFFWWRCQLKLPAMGPLVPEHVFMGPSGMSHWELKCFGLNITSSFFKRIFSLLPFFTWIIFIIRSCVSCWLFSWREVTQTEKPSLNYSPQGIKLVPALRFYHDDCLPGWWRALARAAVARSCSSEEVTAPPCQSRRGSWAGSRPQPLRFGAEHVSVSWNGQFLCVIAFCSHQVHRNKLLS